MKTIMKNTRRTNYFKLMLKKKTFQLLKKLKKYQIMRLMMILSSPLNLIRVKITFVELLS